MGHPDRPAGDVGGAQRRVHPRVDLRQADHRDRRRDPDAPGVQVSQNVVTYEEQILDAELPGSIIIAGSGAIGVEFAYVMKNFGVDVTIVEFLDRMVPTEDADVSKELLKHYKKLGIKVPCSAPGRVHRGHRIRCARDGFSSRWWRPTGPGGRQVAVRDRLRPRTEGYGLGPPASPSPSGEPSPSTTTARPTSPGVRHR